MGSELAPFRPDQHSLVGNFTLPPEYQEWDMSVSDLVRYTKVVAFAFHDPQNYSQQCLQMAGKSIASAAIAYKDSHLLPQSKQILSRILTLPANETLSQAANYSYGTLQFITPYILSLYDHGKNSLQLMLSDLFEAVVHPLQSALLENPLQDKEWIALMLLGTIALVHHSAIHHLKEDPELARAITYGASTGTLTALFMKHDLFIATFSGAAIGLASHLTFFLATHSRVVAFLQEQKEQAKKTFTSLKNLVYKVFPYLVFAFGTATIYAGLRPLIAHQIQEADPSSKRSLVLRLIALSGVLFGAGKTYAIPLADFVARQAAAYLHAATETAVLFSWAPRVLTILSVSSYVSLAMGKVKK